MNRMTYTAIAVVIVAGAVGGCSGETSAKVPAAKDLIGTWAQTGTGYEEGKSVTKKGQTLVIKAADGQGFVGVKEYQNEGEEPQTEVVNGAVGVDGDIRMADEDGFFTGRLVDGKILGQYIEVTKGDAQVLNVELARK